MDNLQMPRLVNDNSEGCGPVGANQCLDRNQEASHGPADGNSPRRKPWASGEKAPATVCARIPESTPHSRGNGWILLDYSRH